MDDEEIDVINKKLMDDAYRYLVIPQEFKEEFIEEWKRLQKERGDNKDK